MNPTAQRALALLRQIKSVTFATVNNGHPAARIIDVMLVKDDGLYFTTARGKSFHGQLMANQEAAISAMSPDWVAVRLVGQVERLDSRAIIDEIFQANPMMNDLYPGEKRAVLDPFRIAAGHGEIFDLSAHPPTRQRYSFGGDQVNTCGYTITDDCTACGLCVDACPVGVIDEGEDIYHINAEHCLECGSCVDVCPEDAVQPALGL